MILYTKKHQQGGAIKSIEKEQRTRPFLGEGQINEMEAQNIAENLPQDWAYKKYHSLSEGEKLIIDDISAELLNTKFRLPVSKGHLKRHPEVLLDRRYFSE